MALTACPDCHRSISALASQCPHCGRPQGSDIARSTSLVRLAFFLLIAGAGAGLAMHFAPERGYWLPGLFFGIGFSLAVRFRPHLLVSFASVAGVIYFVAYHSGLAAASGLLELGVLPQTWMGATWGALAGGLGAFLLLQAIALYFDVRLPVWEWSAPVMGAIAGAFFVHTVLQVKEHRSMLVLVIFFALWQALVGTSCQEVVQARERKTLSGGFSLWLHQTLTGPVVQFLGLVATVLSLVQWFRDAR